jgi:ribosomal protein S18 acetylase RimI-like enzyme
VSVVTVALRPATDADTPFLREVYASTREEELAQVAWAPGQRDAFLRMQFDAQDAHYRQHYPEAERFVIEVDGASAGRLYVDRHGRQEIRIMDIALIDAYRGRGVGRGLLESILLDGRASGRVVRIHVEKHNRALTLYDRLGFRPIEDRGVYWFLECAPSVS